jgi:archaellum component FlaC
MADLAEKMDRMAAEMAALTKQFKPLDEKFTAMIDAIDENKERVLRTKNVLVTIKKKGYEAKSPKYKEIFELLYGKVNGKIKKIADELLTANTTIKKVSSSIATQKLNSESKLNEGMLSNLWNKVKNYITSFTSKIKQQGQSVDADLEKLEKLSLK